MKRYLLFLLAIFVFAACTQNDVEELTANHADIPEILTIGFEGGDDTRIQLNEAQKTVWNEGDLVSVFYLSNANQQWQYQGKTGERVGDIKRVQNATATAQTDKIIVVYPYNSDYYLHYNSCNIQTTLPAVQHYAKDSYGIGDNLMVAQSEFTQFSLKSVCGWLKIQLTGEGQRVKNLTLRGNNKEQLAGLIYVDTATAEVTLASEMDNSDDNNAGGNLVFDDSIITELMLDCGEGVVLGKEATTLYFAVLPQTFEGGFTVNVVCEGYQPMSISTSKAITIKRNHIQPMASVAFNGEKATSNSEIRYTAIAKVGAHSSHPWSFSTFGANILSHEWNSKTGEGVITFDADITTIGEYAFYYCGLTSVTIPDSATTIGEYAFCNCGKLTSITIPDSVTEIRNNAFYNCESLISITIPNSVTEIGNSAFSNCGLTSVTIPNSVTEIRNSAFSSCKSLISITIPNSVTTIGNSAFASCKSLTNVTIGDRVTTIGMYAFDNCKSLTSVTIGDSVTAIGNYAFKDCTNLTSINIPDSVTVIGMSAFYKCASLISITIPNSVTTIGWYAFFECTNLTSVTIGDSVTTIGYHSFRLCPNLTSVYCKAITPPYLDGGIIFDYKPSPAIYVPVESVDDYKGKTSWGEYVDAIVGYTPY